MAKKAVKQIDKIPLGLKIFVGLCAIGLVGTFWDLKAFFEVSSIFGFVIGAPFAVLLNIIGVVFGGVVPIMSVFNRKILFWKLSFWFLAYALVSTVMGWVILLFGSTNSETKIFMSIVFGLIVGLAGWVTRYYYSKKSYFNK